MTLQKWNRICFLLSAIQLYAVLNYEYPWAAHYIGTHCVADTNG